MHLTLETKQPEAGNCTSFRFISDVTDWISGQYMHVILPHDNPDKEGIERFFTISSTPTEGYIQITTRITESTFKQALNALQPGTTIEADGIEGDFTWEDSELPIVMIAGGIGITPFRSILKDRFTRGLSMSVTLLYGNRNNDIPFRSELEQWQIAKPEFKLQLIVGEPLTAELIEEKAPQFKSSLVYLSGPEPMVEAIGAALKEDGLLQDQLKEDFFPGYTEQNF